MPTQMKYQNIWQLFQHGPPLDINFFLTGFTLKILNLLWFNKLLQWRLKINNILDLDRYVVEWLFPFLDILARLADGLVDLGASEAVLWDCLEWSVFDGGFQAIEEGV